MMNILLISTIVLLLIAVQIHSLVIRGIFVGLGLIVFFSIIFALSFKVNEDNARKEIMRRYDAIIEANKKPLEQKLSEQKSSEQCSNLVRIIKEANIPEERKIKVLTEMGRYCGDPNAIVALARHRIEEVKDFITDIDIEKDQLIIRYQVIRKNKWIVGNNEGVVHGTITSSLSHN